MHDTQLSTFTFSDVIETTSGKKRKVLMWWSHATKRLYGIIARGTVEGSGQK